uniref:glucagon-like peptide 1 receptor isoform X1 n=2 Tax=Myxine glutinosa TaxID=7769 RepID=UPI00358F3BAF
MAVQVGPGGAQNSNSILSKTKEQMKAYRNECLHTMSTTPYPRSGPFCNRTFENFICWPDGFPGQMVNVNCPWYIPKTPRAVSDGHAFRQCGTDGSWLWDVETNATWYNLMECFDNSSQHDHFGNIMQLLNDICTVGYSLSLSSLLLASIILLVFRRLHCTRNFIHLNLFASFMLRALSMIWKDAMISQKYRQFWKELSSDQALEHAEVKEDPAICKLTAVLMHYGVTASYCWLLVEGLYLHTLLVMSVVSGARLLRAFVAFGWGTPVLFITPWIVLKYRYENYSCWMQNDNMKFWWIIRLPIMISIVINFFIFMWIISVVISKLRAHQMCRIDIRCRLAKSTLTLIPLLGAHGVVFVFLTEEHAVGTLRYIKLYYELFFASIQGLLVAVLYCFINSEVQAEFRRHWHSWRSERTRNRRSSSVRPLKTTTCNERSQTHGERTDSTDV